MLNYVDICKEQYDKFNSMLTAYYRDGEDKDTAQGDLDIFIKRLYDLVQNKLIEGKFISLDEKIVGFALWMIDRKESDFSEMPGYGTFLEIGFDATNRLQGIGMQVVAHIENIMKEKGAEGFYITAYGPASEFWEKCGYINTHKKASNDLFLYVKNRVNKVL